MRASWQKLVELFYTDTKAMEGLLSFASLWVALRLFDPSFDFDTNLAYSQMLAFGLGATAWGSIFLITALAKLAGLMLLTIGTLPKLSSRLRSTGAFASGCGWAIVGQSFYIGNPYSLSSGVLVLLGAAAFWILIRGPA